MLFRPVSPAGSALDGYRVIVVQDDAGVATAMTSAIRAQGGEVVGPAATMKAAFALAACEPLDCAVVAAAMCGDPCRLVDLLLDEAVPVVLTGDGRVETRGYRGLPVIAVAGDAAALVDAALRAIEHPAVAA